MTNQLERSRAIREEERAYLHAAHAARTVFVRGVFPRGEPRVGIVGTRAASDAALEFTGSLAASLARAGAMIVSGGARGIDAAAHEGALAVAGGTMAVLASGLDIVYPPEHAELFRRIVERGGGLCSFHPDGTEPRRAFFVDRNALIASIADVVVVVEAPARSGALSTAAAARRLGKILLSVPHAPWQVRGKGALSLLRNGAGICTSAADVLSVAARASLRPGRWGVENDDEKRLLGAVSSRPAHLDDVIERSGLPAERVRPLIFQLHLRGIVESVDGCVRALTRSPDGRPKTPEGRAR